MKTISGQLVSISRHYRSEARKTADFMMRNCGDMPRTHVYENGRELTRSELYQGLKETWSDEMIRAGFDAEEVDLLKDYYKHGGV